jgi:exodeoxyribonuclease VII small subunit
MSEANRPQTPPNPPTFEEALAELEQIVEQLEDGDLGLAAALDRYAQGVGLLRQCHALLAGAERRIELLTGVDAQGNPVTEPFDDESSLNLEEQGRPPSARKRRGSTKTARSAESTPPTEIDDGGSLF